MDIDTQKINWLYVFRIRTWQHKINGLRIAVYALLGYGISGQFSTDQLLHFFAVIGLIMASYAVNDYYDWRILRENNFMAKLADRHSAKLLRLIAWSPLLLTGLVLPSNPLVLILFVAMGILVMIYSVPPIRLKERALLGAITPPFAVTLLFAQSVLVTGTVSASFWWMTLIVFTYHIHVEMLHILDDARFKEEAVKMPYITAEKLFRQLPLLVALVGLTGVLISPLFTATALCAILRYVVINSTGSINVASLRHRPWAPEWSPYDLVLYALIGTIAGVIHII